MIDRLLRQLRPRRLEEDPAGGLPWLDIYPARRAAGLRPRTYAPPRSVAAATTPVVLAPQNAARRSLTIVNDSATATLYVGLGAIASSSSFVAALGPAQTVVLEEPAVWQGDVAGVWTAAVGSARVTEST